MAVPSTPFNVTVTVPLSPFFLTTLISRKTAVLLTLSVVFSNSNSPEIEDKLVTDMSKYGQNNLFEKLYLQHDQQQLF
jgi:hypothetical protein